MSLKLGVSGREYRDYQIQQYYHIDEQICGQEYIS